MWRAICISAMPDGYCGSRMMVVVKELGVDCQVDSKKWIVHAVLVADPLLVAIFA
jgi:hypothetical protein